MSIVLSEGQVRQLNTGLVPIYVPPEPATLYGVVSDVDTGSPVAGVLVSLVGTGFSAYTAGDGGYEIVNIPAGTYSVQFSHPDYETLVL